MGWPFWSVQHAVGVSLLVFGLVGVFLIGRAARRPRPRGSPPLPLARNTRVDVVCILGMIAVLALAYLMYARYVDHYAPLTDRATALQYGFEELLGGRNPYFRHTQLDNTISPMLGGILLAGPFVLISGTMYWQGLVWLALTMVFLAVLCGPRFGFAAGAVLLASPAIRLELSVQSDGWLNGAALAIFGTALYLLAGRIQRSRLWLTAAVAMSVVFALAVSYRFIYVVVALPLGVLIWRHFGVRALVVTALPAAVVSLGLILGPYLADPSVYAPFEKVSLGATVKTIPHLPALTAGACVLVAAVGAWRVRTIAGVWATMFAMSMTFIVLTGWGQREWYQYLTWAYNGATIVFGLFALVLPVTPPPGVRERVRRG